jgi:biofilm protein TabA
MIFDHLSNMTTYKGLTPRLDKAFDYIQNVDLSTLDVGKHPIDGEDIFVLIQSYQGKAIEASLCEAHKKFIDIQIILEGDELMGYAPVEGMTVVEPYDIEKDRFFVQWDGTLLNCTSKIFAVFFPQDAHMPGVERTPGMLIKKAVVKVRV